MANTHSQLSEELQRTIDAQRGLIETLKKRIKLADELTSIYQTKAADADKYEHALNRANLYKDVADEFLVMLADKLRAVVDEESADDFMRTACGIARLYVVVVTNDIAALEKSRDTLSQIL
jgi:GTP1/Obg family GTP-binding protein